MESMVLDNQISIIGCGGHARSVADVIHENTPQTILKFYDYMARENEIIMGTYQVLPMEDLIIDVEKTYFVAVGNNKKREFEYNKLVGYHIASVLSKQAYSSKSASIGSGCFVGNYSSIGAEACIGNNCIINTGAIIEHECSIGNHSHISVGAKVCGRTHIGERVFVGAGAVVIDKISICDDVIVAAGAVVVNDIDVSGVYIGVPARRKEEF